MAESTRLKPVKKNMMSAEKNHQVIDDYLEKELEAGNILGPFPRASAPEAHINRFGVIPKKYQPGKWRLITDLSFPEGGSVNDGINPNHCSMVYTTVYQVAARAMSLGRGTLLAKIDIKSAYRLVPICPRDRLYLGMQWKSAVYVDGMLPFGLRSAPKIFNALADGLEWCVREEGVQHVFHYLDDFIVLGAAESPECSESLCSLKQTCRDLGVPLAEEKQDGPTSVITFLGIIIDTDKRELRLPTIKLQRLMEEVKLWLRKRSCTRRELESLIGTMQHACKVITPGRSFLRRVISLLNVAKRRHHHIRLNSEFKADLAWWHVFAAHWNGSSLLVSKESPQTTLTSDASGQWGCGAWHNTQWFQLAWDQRTQDWHIAAKELIPIVIAAVIWGAQWKGKRVLAQCDNTAVVAVLNTRYAKDVVLMRILRCLFFVEAHFQFSLTSTHIPGVHNVLADDLSRNRLPSFLSHMPNANRTPSLLPTSLLQWLLHPNLDWTSPSWATLFSSSVLRA